MKFWVGITGVKNPIGDPLRMKACFLLVSITDPPSLAILENFILTHIFLTQCFPILPPYKNTGKSISCETTFQYLGVVFDNFMTWKAHADYVCKKVASRVSILGRVRSFVTKEAATLVHNALILPLFDYCDIAWSNLLQQDID